ncbi:phage baseplate assembly protein V [Pseudomonas anguilliseptica]|uniref:Phage baseplate assembly protein V n=1 Tax=Pseudomonas anguilliseptica TaxID=53406 RepID=A0A1H5A646_PSEAG|nr:phage baseplate assembly protein V [Pseudomonas anguilliseptica]SED37398.1 phage baseplate assembly protein V [Pseudomonas anguilliseptica]
MRRGLAHIVTRAVVSLVNDAAKMQALQVSLLADEQLDNVEHWQPYGFTAHPLAGAEALVLAVGGHRAHSVVVSCADRRYRLVGMQGGEVAIYTDEKDKIHFKRGRVIDIETHTLNIKAATGVHFDTPEITSTGKIVSAGDQIADGVSQINHVHEDTMPAVDQQSGKPLPGGGA